MMFSGRRIKTIFSLFVMFAIVAIPYANVSAYTKVTPYSRISTAHIFIDDIAYVCSYLVERAILDYQLAEYTGDIKFLQEMKDLFTDIISSVSLVYNMSGLTDETKDAVDEIIRLMKENEVLLAQITSNANFGQKADSAVYWELLSKIDSISNTFNTTVNSAIVTANMDLLYSGSVVIAVRSFLRIGINAMLNRTAYVSDADFASLKDSFEQLVSVANDNIARGEQRNTNPNMRQAYKLLADNMSRLSKTVDDIESASRKLTFSKSIAFPNSILHNNLEKVNDIIHTILLNAVFC